MRIIRFVFASFILLLFGNMSFAQVSSINISGTVKDTLGESVPFATVMLLNKKDSTLVSFTTSNTEGKFALKNVKNTGYILKLSHVSYMPLQKNIGISAEKELNLGIIKVYPFSEMLMEVVVKEARAPLYIKGDTVEYDARTFKVPPGSTVEDLLRRLPGIDVDASGNISSMGKDVRRVYVDGKTFFSDDPTVVTKNLDAEAISKVQVYDEKSEQEKITGIEDGAEDKVMNLELKEEYKKGYFGKASVSGGTEERAAVRGSYNRFNETQQLSFITYGNNINQTGVNWDEYSEFKGQAAFSSRDNVDFGFGNTSQRWFYADGLMNYFDGRGFTENYGGGANYNYFNKKVNFNASYMYNQTDLSLQQFTNLERFLTDTAYYKYDTLSSGEFRNNHSFTTRLEYEIDSMNTLVTKITGKLSGKNKDDIQSQLFKTPDFVKINRNEMISNSDYNMKSFEALAIYTHKFRKKGRRYAISASTSSYIDEDQKYYNNTNVFYLSLISPDYVKYLQDNGKNKKYLKTSLFYVEPITKKISWMTFYNFRKENEISSNLSSNPENNDVRIDSLSLYNPNYFLYNRVGSQLNYSNNGINISLGGAFQSYEMSGTYMVADGLPEIVPELKKTYNNFIPDFSSSIELPNNIRISVEYSYDIEPPDIYYLQPSPNISNPSYIYEGNINLEPETSHYMSGRISYWNRANFTNFSFSTTYIANTNSIVYNQFSDFVDGQGYVTRMIPGNVNGGTSLSSYLWSSFPIIKTKLTMNINAGFYKNDRRVFIDSVENVTLSNNYNFSIGFSYTPNKKLNLFVNLRESLNYVDFSIQKENNQVINNISSSAGFKWQFAKKSFLEGNYSIQRYINDKMEYNQDINMINISVRQILGKKNKFEMRLACFDLLNQNKYIRQYAYQNLVQYTVAPTLARYFMLSISYNLRGFELKTD